MAIRGSNFVGVPQGGLRPCSACHCKCGLHIGSLNFTGLCSDRIQKEVSEVLNKIKFDIVVGQECCERERSL